MTALAAPDLGGHDVAIDAVTAHLSVEPDASVVMPGIGCLDVVAQRPRLGLPGSVRRAVRFREAAVQEGAPAARALPSTGDLVGLAAAVKARLEDAAGVHVPTLGTFARIEGSLQFHSCEALRRRMNGLPCAPMASDALHAALSRFSAEPFGVRELQELLAAATSTEEPEDDVLVDLPAGLPKLLRAALARSAELGNRDAFAFLTPIRREWAWRDYAGAKGSASPPDVFLLSDAGPRSVGLPGPTRLWVLQLSDLGTEDPMVTWCADRASHAASPHRARLSTWLRLFALETVLGPLDRAQTAEVRAAVTTACPEVSTTWPVRWLGEAPDPWLRHVVLTW